MNPTTQRLFFALWPDAALQLQMWQLGQRMQKAFGGRAVTAQNIHLTLAFLGSVPVDRIDELRDIGQSIHTRCFQLDLTQTGCWKRSAVGWIAPDHLPLALDALVMTLRQRLHEAGFSVDDKPFAPHLTLFRKAKCRENAVQPEAPFDWPVNHFALVRSETRPTGPIYQPIGTWPLE